MTNHSPRGAENAPRDTPVPYTPVRPGPRQLNTELLERVRQIILMRPELHNQQTWGRTPSDVPVGVTSARAETGEYCGTTACVAGWAAILSAPEDALMRDGCICVGANEFSISLYAARQLGLSWDQQTWLFPAEATRERVLWTLKWLPDHPDAGTPELWGAWKDELSAQRPEGGW